MRLGGALYPNLVPKRRPDDFGVTLSGLVLAGLSEKPLLFRRYLDQHIGEDAVGASVELSTSTNRHVKQRKGNLKRGCGHTNHSVLLRTKRPRRPSLLLTEPRLAVCGGRIRRAVWQAPIAVSQSAGRSHLSGGHGRLVFAAAGTYGGPLAGRSDGYGVGAAGHPRRRLPPIR